MFKTIFIFVLFMHAAAAAETVSETSCFVSYGKSDRSTRLALKTYFDKEINKVVGAYVQYGEAKGEIQLVLADAIINDEGFEDHWLEVFKRNITGEYIYKKQGVGGGIGAYSLSYKNFKTGKTTDFSLSSGASGKCFVPD